MLDDTRCGLDASSLHRATSMDISLSKKLRLLSCHRDTSIFKIKMLIKVSKNNIHIENSYEVKTRNDMQLVLNDIRAHHSLVYCDVLLRTDKSLINEWCAHNLLYNLHLFRKHTKDVDLNYPQRKIVEIAYSIISAFLKI